VHSCLVLAVAVDEAEIVTVEGLAGDGELHPAQQAFHEEHALQCGFCTPGLLMTLAHLGDRAEGADEDEMLDHLGGHLCRCTGYAGIKAAGRACLRRQGS
jgi:aerobic-type carbon monoxide dehydrogenase small subunit (CoxS/CutS family)